jgi:hypothetical protein
MLSELSQALTGRYGRGFSVTNLKYSRLFYQAYSERRPRIRHEVRDELAWLENGALDDLVDLQDRQEAMRKLP